MLLKVSNISKHFGGLLALSNVSFEMKEGELSSMIGPNGAGKSTLFNVLTGYLKADGGEFFFNGENITALRPYQICRKRLGRSFQRINIFSRLSVFENIQISVICGRGEGLRFLTPYSRLAHEGTFDIIETVGLKDHWNKLAGELPYGDQKRLELAITLTNNPKLVLLDEPTAGLSPSETKQMIRLIEKLAGERKIAVLLVEHDMEVVFSLSKRILVLHQGKIIAEGTPDEIKVNREVQTIYLGEEKSV